MSINFESHKLDRRSFLKGAGMVGAASLLAACGGKSDNGSTGGSTSGAAAPQHHRRHPAEGVHLL